jgi:hypothetical protein
MNPITIHLRPRRPLVHIYILLLHIITLQIIVLILDTLFIHFVWRFSENYILRNRQNGKRGLHKLEKRQRRKQMDNRAYVLTAIIYPVSILPAVLQRKELRVCIYV